MSTTALAHETGIFLIPTETQVKIKGWLTKFPEDKKKSGVLYALKLVQADNQGWLSIAAMDAVARFLGLPKIAVYEVASFYSMYELKPVGRHVLSICTNISCQLNGCENIVKHLKARLGIDWHQTTSDGRFTLKPVECLAACDLAPVLQVGEATHGHLTPESLDALLETLA